MWSYKHASRKYPCMQEVIWQEWLRQQSLETQMGTKACLGEMGYYVRYVISR